MDMTMCSARPDRVDVVTSVSGEDAERIRVAFALDYCDRDVMS